MLLFPMGQHGSRIRTFSGGPVLNDRRSYRGITGDWISSVIHELTSGGAQVSGNNPWHIDTLQHGVKMKVEWREETSMLFVTITNRNWYVSRHDIWNTIETLMKSGPMKS